jgi:hypothetical protein
VRCVEQLGRSRARLNASVHFAPGAPLDRQGAVSRRDVDRRAAGSERLVGGGRDRLDEQPALRRATAADERLLEEAREIVRAALGASTLRRVFFTGALKRVLHPCVSVRTTPLRDASSTLRLANGIASACLRGGDTVAQRGGALAESAIANGPGKSHAGVPARPAMSVVHLEVVDAVAVPARRATQTYACLLAITFQIAKTLVAREAGAIDRSVRAHTAGGGGAARAADFVARRLRDYARVHCDLTARAATSVRAGCPGPLLHANVGDAHEAREALAVAALASARSDRARRFGLSRARRDRCVGGSNDKYQLREARGRHGRSKITRFAVGGELNRGGRVVVSHGR